MNYWVKITEDCERCPECGVDQRELPKKDFDAKLIRAPNHSEPETVLMAIEAIELNKDLKQKFIV